MFGAKKGRRTCWRRRPAAGSTSEPLLPQVTEAPVAEDVEALPEGVLDQEVLTLLREEPLKVMARLLMMNSYAEPMQAERAYLEEAGLMEQARALQSTAQPSSYLAQGRGQRQKLGKEQERRAHEAAAIASRQAHQRRHMFSICARSITKFMRRVPKKDWADALKNRE